MAKTVTLTIDGKQVGAAPDSTILQAARQAGIEIPTLCQHDKLPHFTSCFLCVVEVAGRKNPAPACSTNVVDGMIVSTDTENIRKLRKLCIELLLSDHSGDCVAPCTLTCPAGCGIQDFMRDLSEGAPEKAIRKIKETLPIPGALGRICPRPCEAQCRRFTVEEPLAIGWLHRHAADLDAENKQIYRPAAGAETGKRVAIVGGGPAGMSAGYFLRQLGHGVVVFEAEHELGGMLRWGIPAYRLPREELGRELQALAEMGMELRFGKALGRDFLLADLQREFDAVFLAVGAPLSSALRVPGEDLPGVLQGLDFLGQVAHGAPVKVGPRAVVIGGGNTAIDAVRTARRAGATIVTLLYRRTRAEMPALPVEIEAAEQEGTEFRLLAAPLSIRRENGHLVLQCQQMELGKIGPDGRRQPVPVDGAVFDLDAETIITAVGQKIDGKLLADQGLALEKNGSKLVVNPFTMETSVPGVFGGGDAAATEAQKIAVWAVGSGHVAAAAIDQYLRREKVTGPAKNFTVTMGASPQEVTPSRFSGIEEVERVIMPELEPLDRVTSFREVELGLTPAMAQKEARRCLACGCAQACNCQVRVYAKDYGSEPRRLAGACRDYLVDTSHPDIVLEPGKCISCGICVRLCKDQNGLGIFGFANRGFEARVKTYFDLSEEGRRLAMQCAEACPTGAIVKRDQLGQHVCFPRGCAASS